MVRKYFLFLFLLVFGLSCTSPTNKVDTSPSVTTVDEVDNNDDTNFKVVALNREKTGFFPRQSIYGEKEQSAFRACFSLKNNTNNIVTSFKIGAFILLKFDDNKAETIPYPNNGQKFESLEKYHDEVENKNFKSNVSVAKPWKNGQVREFNFEIFKTWGFQWVEINFPNSWFQRTPKEVFFVYRYKAITVDKEYEKEIYSDILQEWKDYQNKLGLR